MEVECNELRREAIEAPKRQQAELERISRELKQSRERVIQLEKKLRAEFQSQMDVMIAERDVIQAQLKQKVSRILLVVSYSLCALFTFFLVCRTFNWKSIYKLSAE